MSTGLVPLSAIKPDPENLREEMGDVDGLANSMHEMGLLQPIILRKSGRDLFIVAGHRRYAAARHLGWLEIPAMIRKEMRTDQVLAAMLIENGQRKDLDPIEEARGLARLKTQLGCTKSELATKIGRSPVYVANRILLLNLPVKEQQQIRGGQFGVTAAIAKARVETGRTHKKGNTKAKTGHFSELHPLSHLAKSRCDTMGHPGTHGKRVNGLACGECWEAVIRANERQEFANYAVEHGACPICDEPTRGVAS